ncbi:hypothetical protein [Mesorhizobium sp.]|uniref:hypothetical protein n=1 Tax=Mesorhizobium sp. TaxID=1871066 RepID=UPI002580BFF6|nr:hypothetical protein [Mesorhizobium sp.]
MKNLDRSANQSEEEYYLRFAFQPSEAPKKCKNSESGFVIQLVQVGACIESEFLDTWHGQKCKHKNGKQQRDVVLFQQWSKLNADRRSSAPRSAGSCLMSGAKAEPYGHDRIRCFQNQLIVLCAAILWQSANAPLCPACDCQPERHAGAVGNPVEYIQIAPYQLRALKNLDRRARKSEENNQPRLVFRPTEASESRQDSEGCGMVELVIMKRDGHAEIRKEPHRQKSEQENAGQRDPKNDPCRDWIRVCGQQDRVSPSSEKPGWAGVMDLEFLSF